MLALKWCPPSCPDVDMFRSSAVGSVGGTVWCTAVVMSYVHFVVPHKNTHHHHHRRHRRCSCCGAQMNREQRNKTECFDVAACGEQRSKMQPGRDLRDGVTGGSVAPMINDDAR